MNRQGLTATLMLSLATCVATYAASADKMTDEVKRAYGSWGVVVLDHPGLLRIDANSILYGRCLWHYRLLDVSKTAGRDGGDILVLDLQLHDPSSTPEGPKCRARQETNVYLELTFSAAGTDSSAFNFGTLRQCSTKKELDLLKNDPEAASCSLAQMQRGLAN